MAHVASSSVARSMSVQCAHHKCCCCCTCKMWVLFGYDAQFQCSPLVKFLPVCTSVQAWNFIGIGHGLSMPSITVMCLAALGRQGHRLSDNRPTWASQPAQPQYYRIEMAECNQTVPATSADCILPFQCGSTRAGTHGHAVRLTDAAQVILPLPTILTRQLLLCLQSQKWAGLRAPWKVALIQSVILAESNAPSKIISALS